MELLWMLGGRSSDEEACRSDLLLLRHVWLGGKQPVCRSIPAVGGGVSRQDASPFSGSGGRAAEGGSLRGGRAWAG